MPNGSNKCTIQCNITRCRQSNQKHNKIQIMFREINPGYMDFIDLRKLSRGQLFLIHLRFVPCRSSDFLHIHSQPCIPKLAFQPRADVLSWHLVWMKGTMPGLWISSLQETIATIWTHSTMQSWKCNLVRSYRIQTFAKHRLHAKPQCNRLFRSANQRIVALRSSSAPSCRIIAANETTCKVRTVQDHPDLQGHR
jgi:hypothetical protein